MKKITLLLLTIFNLCLFAQTNPSTDVIPPKIVRKAIVYKIPTKPFVTSTDYYNAFNVLNNISPKLYGQLEDNFNNIISQQFETANNSYSATAADDFVVPANQAWTINSVFAKGIAVTSVYPTSYNVIFYENSASNLPDTVIHTENVVLSAGSVSPTLTLATPLFLSPGTYWVSVQAVGNFADVIWYWQTYTSSETLNQSFAWRNPGNGFATACSTSWNTASVCLSSQLKDLQFSLDGDILTPCKTITDKLQLTDATSTARLNRNGVESVCGTTKTFPGTVAGAYHYRTYTLQNMGTTSDCVTFSLQSKDPAVLNQVHLSAYSGTFNPADLSVNYLGDIGASSYQSITRSMDINVPANSTVTLVVNEATANTVFTNDFIINVFSANCSILLKTKENDGLKNVSIYPNPTSKLLYVNGMNVKTAKVFDATGKLIPIKNSGNQLNVEVLPKGNYILKMEDKEGKSTTTKFIKK